MRRVWSCCHRHNYRLCVHPHCRRRGYTHVQTCTLLPPTHTHTRLQHNCWPLCVQPPPLLPVRSGGQLSPLRLVCPPRGPSRGGSSSSFTLSPNAIITSSHLAFSPRSFLTIHSIFFPPLLKSAAGFCADLQPPPCPSAASGALPPPSSRLLSIPTPSLVHHETLTLVWDIRPPTPSIHPTATLKTLHSGIIRIREIAFEPFHERALPLPGRNPPGHSHLTSDPEQRPC